VDKENLFGLTEKYMRENGLMEKYKEMEKLFGRMEIIMKGIGCKELKMVKENLFMLIVVHFIKEVGKMEKGMEKENFLTQIKIYM
jgi:hypothetical protein